MFLKKNHPYFMDNNPFLSEVFLSLWSKHFYPNKIANTFEFIDGPIFYKPSPLLPLYINIGKNHTKGMSYTTNNAIANDYKNKMFLIYDVPEYFQVNNKSLPKKLNVHKIKQYPGFLVDLKNYADFNHYFTSTFSKSSRYKLTKYKKRLESCFDISYHMYHGPMDRDVYDRIFDSFKTLLERRFLDKGISNNNLDPKEWNFYHEVAYPMILEKKASLFVIYNGDVPIGITLNYFSENIVFDAITVFDIDYEKFHLGSVTIMKLIEWTLNQGLRYFDFSKGYFDYKKRWANREYDFEYHVYYDRSSILSIAMAQTITFYFNFKQYLRDKNLNTKFHNLTFLLRNRKPKDTESKKYQFSPVEAEASMENYIEINRYNDEWNRLSPITYEFLYLNNESQKDLRIKKNIVEDHKFIFEGHEKKVMLTISK